MGWIDDILRKDHRACEQCGLGPTHVYDPMETDEEIVEGTPLCNTCLPARLAADLTAFRGKGLLFEPALGPVSLVFVPLDQSNWTEASKGAVRHALDGMGQQCQDCRRPGRFLWVAAERDANLWDEDWPAALV